MFKFCFAIISLIVFYSCKTPAGVFTKKTAHEEYGDRLTNSGLQQTALGIKWFDAAMKAVSRPIPVQLPYKENGYFAADRPDAGGFSFDAKRGEQLTVELTSTPAYNYLLFADLFLSTNAAPKFIQSLDTIQRIIRYTVKQNSNFILRIQPELLQSGSYTLTIKIGPSLAYPVPSPTSKNRIISFWGAGRDNGARKHEGVDIGGSLRTPLVAVGDGYVNSVTENNLGGKVVFIRSAQSNETWYYAHLDSQIATNGQRVKKGDLIGLMGNTGNARTTSPHLHFGIYTTGGAIDPLHYINPVQKEPSPVIASTTVLGTRMRTGGKKVEIYISPDKTGKENAGGNLPVLVTAATGNLYKAVLPGGERRFIPATNLVPTEKAIRQLTIKEELKLLDSPMIGSPVIETLNGGSSVALLGIAGNFQYVMAKGKTGWILSP